MRTMTPVWPCLALFFAAGCCDQIQEDARDLKAKHARCEAGDTCALVSMYDLAGDNTCLGAFQCSAALNEADLDGFSDAAKDLAERFEHCNECVQAGCADTEGLEAYCNVEIGECSTRPADGDGGV